MIGIDIVKVSRFSRLTKKADFLEKHFSKNELLHFKEKKEALQTIAGIFACKEAFLKAIGVGVLNGIKLDEIEVVYEQNGKPKMQISAEILSQFKIKDVQVSISHDGGFAVAVCQVF